MNLTLTAEQEKVANHQLPGHARVLAGPGTGKSTAAIELARRLMLQNPRPRIKFLTFTRAATAELRKNLADAGTEAICRPSTIHSFSISCLLMNPGCATFPEPLRIPDDFELEELIRPHLARRIGVGVRKLDELFSEMAAEWESLNPQALPTVTQNERSRFVGGWKEHRGTFGYTRVSELPALMRSALLNNDDLDGVDYDLLIVDEYQDLNACDLHVLRTLAERGASILACGDDDQSVYSFRKAHPAGIRRFLNEYNTSCDYKLTICHRSSKSIMDWANHVIVGDVDRIPRNPPSCLGDPPGCTLKLLRFRSERSEAKGVADIVEWLHDKKSLEYADILVLSRTDRSGTFTKPLRDELGKRGIPVANPATIEATLAEPMNRRILAILRLAVNPIDSLAWWTLFHLENGIGDAFVNHLYSLAKDSDKAFGDVVLEEQRTRFRGFNRMVSERAYLVWTDTSNTINGIKVPTCTLDLEWGKWILGEIHAGRLPPCSQSFEKLLTSVDQELETGEELGRYLSQIKVVGEDLMRTRPDGVHFATMTGSKGLTVKATIVLGVDNDLVPRVGEKSSEERRLLYVSMTRSKSYLFLTWAGMRRGPAARSGRINTGRRQASEFLVGGPVNSEDGISYTDALSGSTPL